MPRPAQTDEQRNEVRRRILDVAQELLDTSGIDAVSMRAIGSRVGLSASALYAYFPARDDILRALWWDALDALYERMRTISAAAEEPEAAIRGFCLAYVDFAIENPTRFRVLFALERPGGGRDLDMRNVRHAAYALLRQRVAQGIQQGRFRVPNADLVAQTAWAGIHGVASLVVSAPGFEFERPDELATTVIDSLLIGLTTDTSRV